MKKLIIIESAAELLNFANRTRTPGDQSPILPSGAKIIIDCPTWEITLENADGFELGDDINGDDMVELLASLAGIKLETRGITR